MSTEEPDKNTECEATSEALEPEIVESVAVESSPVSDVTVSDVTVSDEPVSDEPASDASELDIDLLPKPSGEATAKKKSRSSSRELVQYDPLRHYLAEIRHLPTLTREEEHELALRFQEGDKAAGYQLVLANLRLVVMIAREYQRNVQNVLDLVQEGNIGLLEAVKKYDPFRGVRFPSYAVYWVRAYMLRYLINNVRLVKVGTTQAQRKLFFNLMKEKEKLEREGFVPEAKLLAERLDVKESEVIEMQQRLALPDVSVDQPVGKGEDALDLHGVLADDTESAEELEVQGQFDDALREAVLQFKDQADEKEKAIIDQRLFTEEPVTLQVIADQFGVSRERIRQIESRLKTKLKEYLSDRLEL